jgi:PAS domain S-box-containing protein
VADQASDDRPADPTTGAIEEGRSLSDRDQTLAEVDQTGSDSDQISADRDQAASERDQAASDRLLAAGGDPAVLGVASELRGRGVLQREQNAKTRLESAAARDSVAGERDLAALARDRVAMAGNAGSIQPLKDGQTDSGGHRVPQEFALGTRVERVFAEILGGGELGLYVFEADDPGDSGSLRLVYANPASALATGVAIDEIIGRPLREGFPGMAETSLSGIFLEIALGGDARELGEIDFGNRPEPTQVFSVRAFPLSNQSVGVSFTDFTSLRESEQQVVQTLESMSDAFFTLDSQWRFTYMNPQSETILERRREDLVGKNMWEEFPEGIGRGFDEAYRRALRDQVPVHLEGVYDPLGRTLEVRAYPVTGGGLAVYFSDVTTERLHDRRLREAQRLEAIGRVTAGVAHDFNNLLTAICGFASLGEAASVDEETATYFAEIDAAGHRAVQLTRQLLAFARKQELSPRRTDLNEAVEGLVPLLDQLLPDRIELRLALSPQPVAVFVDSSQLEQVLINLVVNGRDAINATGSIAISTATERPSGVKHDVGVESGWLQVTDTGSGIPEDVRPHIFDPFFSTKPPETGTGLGLATSYGFISQSGGDILVDSTLGIGTTITITLPTTQPTESQPPGAEPTHRLEVHA